MTPTLALTPLLLVAAPFLRVAQEHPRAVDGHRGLGVERPVSEILGVFRTTSADERAFLADLAGLAGEVRLLLAGVSESYRAAGWFELLEPGMARDLNTLHSAWRASEAQPMALLSAGGPRARALVQMSLDARARVRADLSQGLELDAREVEAGLAVLRGAAEGFVQLGEEETRVVAQRVDLAASLLRARRSDLLALRPKPVVRDGPRRDPEVDALLSAARDPDRARARAAVHAALTQAAERSEQMKRALFSPRLTQQVAGLLEWRQRSLAEAARLRQEALAYLPDGEAGREAPAEIQALRKSERVRWAGFRARDGLVSDPLDDVLAYIAAHAADFQWGSLESVPLYDRFLVLRGIRHYDHRTLKGRRLDPWEQEALITVQGPYQPPPRPQPRDEDGRR